MEELFIQPTNKLILDKCTGRCIFALLCFNTLLLFGITIPLIYLYVSERTSIIEFTDIISEMNYYQKEKDIPKFIEDIFYLVNNMCKIFRCS